MIELEREGAGARRRRADFDNEVADLGLRHFRPHHVPALPAVAGIEAQNLAATSGQQRVDLCRRFVRTSDLDEVDGLKQPSWTPIRPAVWNAMSEESTV